MINHEIAALYPGCFALVMASGIISNALFFEGYHGWTDALFTMSQPFRDDFVQRGLMLEILRSKLVDAYRPVRLAAGLEWRVDSAIRRWAAFRPCG
jgi:hypothetical protein